jgi:hypothetical protein
MEGQTNTWAQPEALVDKETLAARHERSPRSVERDIQQGVGVPHLKIGKKTLFRVRDVLAWEEEHLFGSTAEARAAKEREAVEMVRRYEERQRTIDEAKAAEPDEAAAARRRHQEAMAT